VCILQCTLGVNQIGNCEVDTVISSTSDSILALDIFSRARTPQVNVNGEQKSRLIRTQCSLVCTYTCSSSCLSLVRSRCCCEQSFPESQQKLTNVRTNSRSDSGSANCQDFPGHTIHCMNKRGSPCFAMLVVRQSLSRGFDVLSYNVHKPRTSSA